MNKVTEIKSKTKGGDEKWNSCIMLKHFFGFWVGSLMAICIKLPKIYNKEKVYGC